MGTLIAYAAHDLGWRILAAVLLTALIAGMRGISTDGRRRP